MSILSKINEFKKKAQKVRDVSSAINQGVEGIRGLVTGRVEQDVVIQRGIESVERMKANLNKGVARQNRYAVYMTPPRMLAGENTSYLMFRTQATELPGLNLNTFNHTPMGFGAPRAMPAGYTLYPNLGIDFISSADYREWKFFSSWFDGIVKRPTQKAENQGDTHMLNYYDDYTCQISIVAYDELGNPTYECYFNDAYPLQLTPVALNWGANDGYVAFPVQFAYRNWYDKTIRDGFESRFPNILTGIDSRIGAQIVGALETGLGAFGIEDKLPTGVRDAVNVITGGGLLNFN